ncbi:MAG: hypothetical protein K2W92_06645 [Alphaproteobacteria bacterium]|nr:hypothetical protein [Alphaproteobacteria bacterium]
MIKNFFIYTSVVSLIIFEVHALKLYLISNHDHAEDHSQALGIGAAFENLSSEKVSIEDLNAKTLTSLEIKDKIERDLSKEKVVFIGIGEGGIADVIGLPKDPNLVICLASSTALEQYKDKALLEQVDFIALPTHVASDVKEKLGKKLIETTGVAHNRRPDMTTYDEYQKELPPADLYLGVYLGGDTPTDTKEVKFFAEADATRLADYVIVKAEEINQRGLKPCVLVLNSPRTGTHDIDGKELLTVHREGRSDRVTEHFANKLADKGIEYKIFDFQRNTSENKEWVSAYNAFDLVAGAVRTTKGKMIIPGENTFVVSEAVDIMPFESIDTMPPGKVLVYHNAAMNDIHIAHIESEKDAGRVSVLENYQNIMPASETAEVKPSASRVIAQKLVKIAFNQAPWIAEDSLYRRTKKQESVEKVRQYLEIQSQIKAEKNPHLLYDLIDK